MASSRHIDRICVIAIVCTLLLTILFMNGQRLGLTVMADEDTGGGQFTANDLDGDWAAEADDATRIVLTGDGAEIHGNGAYFYDGSVQIVYAGRYLVSGQLNNGSLVVDADKDDKVWLLMDGASIRNEDGAAILVEQAEKVFLTLADGTENEIAGWTAASEDSGTVISSSGSSGNVLGNESGNASASVSRNSSGNASGNSSGDIDGAIYSRDDLTINGSGSLSVTTGYQHAIVCNDDLVITGGQIAVTAPQDGLHANDSVRIADADLTIRAGDDGITVSNDDSTAYFYMESGSVTIPSCYEGIEAIDITIDGGRIDITPTDDGINANGYGTSAITISGGDIRIVNPTGRDADGLDSNGSIYITGGNLFISVNGSGSNCALDCGTESGGVCEISGGTVIAAGGSGMAEGFDSSSEQCFIMQTVSTTAENASVTLKNGSGETLLSGTVPCSFSSIILSAPQLQMGETCTVVIDGTETEVVVDNSSAGGFGMGGRFGGMRGGMNGGMNGDMSGGMNGGMTGGMGRKADRIMSGETGGSPDGESSQIPDGESPQIPDGESSQTPNGERPQIPDGESPQIPDGESPQIPDGGSPQIPDGGSSQTPNGERPQIPDGESSRFPGTSPSDNSDAGSGDVSDPAQYRMKFRDSSGDNSFQPGQNGDFMQRGQWQNRNIPAAGTETITVSPETWFLIGISALCLAAGLLIAVRFRH